MSSSSDPDAQHLGNLLTSLRRYRDEELAQARQEQDERRRAWHDGRASAYLDVIERLRVLLPDDTGDASTAPSRHN